MSTFAVFGMTRPIANKLAKRSVDKKLLKGNKYVPESEYLEMVSEKSDEIMKTGGSVMLSEKFDAPHFAKDFVDLAKKIEHRDLSVRAYCKSGYRDPKTGREKMHWTSEF